MEKKNKQKNKKLCLRRIKKKKKRRTRLKSNVARSVGRGECGNDGILLCGWVRARAQTIDFQVLPRDNRYATLAPLTWKLAPAAGRLERQRTVDFVQSNIIGIVNN